MDENTRFEINISGLSTVCVYVSVDFRTYKDGNSFERNCGAASVGD